MSIQLVMSLLQGSEESLFLAKQAVVKMQTTNLALNQELRDLENRIRQVLKNLHDAQAIANKIRAN